MSSKIIRALRNIFRVSSGVLAGRVSAGVGRCEELTPSQARTLLDVRTADEVSDEIAAAVATISIPVTSVAGRTGAVTLTKSDVGLGNVDNVSGANAVVSTAQQTALNAKVAGPASATDNAVCRFDLTTGKVIQNSSVTISDAGVLSATANDITAPAGSFICSGSLSIGAGGSMNFTARARFRSPSIGAIIARNANDDADASFSAADLTASGLLCAGVYTVGTLPTVSTNAGKWARLSTPTQQPRFSDGSFWRRFGDDSASIGIVTNRYYSCFNSGAVTTQQLVANTVYYLPFFVPEVAAWTRLGINVTTGVSGAARLGIYNNVGGVPSGAPLLDAGTVATTSTGEQEITISQTLAPGWYWLAIVANATATLTAESVSGSTQLIGLGSASGSAADALYYTQASTYGALPTVGTLTGVTGTTAPRLWMRKFVQPPTPYVVAASTGTTYPAGILAGDLLVCWGGTPSGFTVGSNGLSTKTATGAEAGAIGVAHDGFAVIRQWTSGTLASSNTATVNVPVANSLIVVMGWSEGDGGVGDEIVAPSGWTRHSTSTSQFASGRIIAVLSRNTVVAAGNFTHTVSISGYNAAGVIFSIG
jgi:hypothetical protein